MVLRSTAKSQLRPKYEIELLLRCFFIYFLNCALTCMFASLMAQLGFFYLLCRGRESNSRQFHCIFSRDFNSGNITDWATSPAAALTSLMWHNPTNLSKVQITRKADVETQNWNEMRQKIWLFPRQVVKHLEGNKRRGKDGKISWQGHLERRENIKIGSDTTKKHLNN